VAVPAVVLAGALLAVAASPAPAAELDPNALAAEILTAETNRRAIPVLTLEHPEIDMETAYAVQRAYIRRRIARGDRIGGFKAGLTGVLGRLWFGTLDPLFGVVFASGRRGDKAEIRLASYRRLIMETEIVLVVGRRITQQVADVAALKPMIRGAAPAVEMPETGFTHAGRAAAEDLAAANSASAVHVVGRERRIDDIDLKRVRVVLRDAREELSSGRGSQALGGDPWESALWLVNAAILQGWTVERGNLLFTGILGDRTTPHPGEYVGDYGPLGTLRFTLR